MNYKGKSMQLPVSTNQLQRESGSSRRIFEAPFVMVMSQVARGKLDHGKLARPKLDLGKLARAKPARQKLAKLLN